MRQQGIDRKCRERVVRLGQLFHQPDAIHDDVRTNVGEKSQQRVCILDIDPRDQARTKVAVEKSCRTRRAQCAEDLEAFFLAEEPEHRVPEHPRGAQDQEPHLVQCHSLDPAGR